MKTHTLKNLTTTSLEDLPEAVESAIANEGPSWQQMGKKFLRFIQTGNVEFTIFAKGNGKLPFFAFSALPGSTCPGAGDCLNWCYSFRAWRYPASFFRQLQNTILVQRQDPQILQAWQKIPKSVVVRLYVDGDIDSLETLNFWMDACRGRPDLQVYGYSKSWMIFLQFKKDWPENYTLNLSQGSRYGDGIKRLITKLPIVRGEFIAVPIKKSLVRKMNTPEYRQAVKEAANEKVFVCPGKCGDCLNGKHACGNDRMQDVKIAIGIH